ncbi:hypothetical protein C0995_008443 [Termitomyces sp. Mi166|nr:hypothetical protein C0995_008443 [Termitomyces sp. Mi166\
MLSHVLPSHPPALLIPKYLPHYPHFASPKPLHPPSFSHSYPTSLSPIQPDSPATVEDDIPSPHSPHFRSGSYHYANRSTGSFDSPVSPAEMYESNLQPHSYPPAQSYSSEPSSQPNYQFIDNSTVRGSQFDLSESPSPVDPHLSSSYPADISANQSQDRRSSQISPSYLPHDRFNASPDTEPDRYSRNIGSDKYSEDNNPHFSAASIDQRRMSEPALPPSNPYSEPQPHRIQSQSNYNTSSLTVPSAYAHSLQRGTSIGSLRDLRHAHLDYSTHTQPPYSGWKEDSHHRSHQLGGYHGNDEFDVPISPLQPDLTGALGPREAGAQYSPTTAENLYGTSPPGTAASTSSLGPLSPVAESFAQKDDNTGDSSNKTYSFVPLPGNTVKKRPRRRYDEIERLYRCSWPDCNKAYGTLNHLNAHVTMQKHGPKRQPSGKFFQCFSLPCLDLIQFLEFKELRKQWRKAKKSASPGPVRRNSVTLRHDSQQYNARRYESQSESNASLLTHQHSYYVPAVPPSGLPIVSEPSDKMPFPVEGSRHAIDERDDPTSIYSAHGRQRYSSSATWQGSTRSHPQQYLSSSLPNQPSGFVQDSDQCFPSDTRGPQSQRSRSQSSLEPLMGRLPPDSTLLTPLPRYQSSLPPLQEGEHRDVPYSAGTDYEMFDNGRDGRPHTGHRSLGDNEEKY